MLIRAEEEEPAFVLRELLVVRDESDKEGEDSSEEEEEEDDAPREVDTDELRCVVPEPCTEDDVDALVVEGNELLIDVRDETTALLLTSEDSATVEERIEDNELAREVETELPAKDWVEERTVEVDCT